MNTIQSSSEQFGQHLKSVGGSEVDVSGSDHSVTGQDTVESVASGPRMKQRQHRASPSGSSIIHAAAQVPVSRRDAQDPARYPGASQSGQYQLDIHLAGTGHRTREAIPLTDLDAAKVWALGRIEAENADFGAIYFPTGGRVAPGTGVLECSFDRAVGWYR